MTRRHRMMFTVDEHRRRRGPLAPSGDAQMVVVSPIQFGPLCFAVAALRAGHFPGLPRNRPVVANG